MKRRRAEPVYQFGHTGRGFNRWKAPLMVPSALVLSIALVLQPPTGPLSGIGDASAKVTVTRTSGLVTYRVTERPKGLGPVTLVPGTATKVVFERMLSVGNAGGGDANYVVPPSGDGSLFAAGTTTLETGEGLWTPIRRTITIEAFSCSAGSNSAAPGATNVVRTKATFTSSYRPDAPFYEAGSRYLKSALKKGLISQRQYRRLRDERGDITFRTVLGRARIVDTITADPYRALAFTGIPNQGVKIVKFVLKPGETKSQTVEVDVDCAFDPSYAGDGRKGQWVSMWAKTSPRVYGNRPAGVPDHIWTYIRRFSDSGAGVIYTKQPDVRR